MTTYDLSRRRWYRPTLAELETEAWNSPILEGVLLYEFKSATVMNVLDEIQRIGRPPVVKSAPKVLDVSGFLLPVHSITPEGLAEPCWLNLPGVPVMALPIFSSLSMLRRAVMELPDFDYTTVKQIDDGLEFVYALPRDGSIELIIDPYLTEEKNVRYKRVLL